MKKYNKHDFYKMVYEKNNGAYPIVDVTWIVKETLINSPK